MSTTRTRSPKKASSEFDIWNRIFEPTRPEWTAAAAESILKLDFPTADKVRMNALAAKAREGSLTPSEDAELEAFIRVGQLLTILQSKARLSLHPPRRKR